MIDELDSRLTDALFDAAASTTVSDDAFDAVMRRAATPARKIPGRRAAVIGACAATVATGVAGFIATRPSNQAEAPAVEVAAAETTVAPDETLPMAGLVDGPLVYDDATLLSILYNNFGVGTVEDVSRARNDPRSAAADAAMRQCVEQLGFQYPNVLNSWAAELATDPHWTLTPSEFAAQYGFGIAAEQLGLFATESAEAYNDYVGSLTSGEREAFDAAEQQCYRENAGLLPYAGESWVGAHDYAHAQFEPMVEEDDRVVAARDTWRACMAASGHDFDDPETIASDFGVRLAAADLITFGTPPEPGTPLYDDLHAFMADEIVVATANVECVTPYNETVRAVIGELYPQYKEIFQAALDAGVEPQGEGLR